MKYKVNYSEVHSCQIEVEADNPSDARDKVEDLVDCNVYFENTANEPKYEYSLDKSTWEVSNEKGSPIYDKE